MKIGSLCTGVGGLDMGIAATIGGEVVWMSEVDKQANIVLGQRFDGVPNFGSVKDIDWSTVEPVDVLCAGYPCQPFSTAGRRRGAEDPRHLWPFVAEAIRQTRPRWVVLENVRGHLTKGFGQVIGELADAGFHAAWSCFRSSDVGAPHRRERVFIVASDTDIQHGYWRRNTRTRRRIGGSIRRREDDKLLPTPAANEPGGTLKDYHRRLAEHDGRKSSFVPLSMVVQKLLPTPTAVDAKNGRNETAGRANPDSKHATGTTLCDDAWKGSWGEYQAAIDQWSALFSPPPSPVDDQGRLNPAFPEWMMGFPRGWVTDLIPQRTHALRLIGNAVQSQVAMLAVSALLVPWMEAVA